MPGAWGRFVGCGSCKGACSAVMQVVKLSKFSRNNRKFIFTGSCKLSSFTIADRREWELTRGRRKLLEALANGPTLSLTFVALNRIYLLLVVYKDSKR
jgi:hypothetical protein